MKKKIIVSLFTAALMVLCLFPTVSFAADLNFDLKDYADGSVINIGAGDTAIIQDTSVPAVTHYNVQIVCGEGAKVTLKGVKIDNSAYDGVCPLSFSGNGNTLTLAGGYTNSLTAGAGQPAVRVEGVTDLTIGGGLGTLNAEGGISAAGLGGGSGHDCGMISISMGTVTADGGSGGAGIGGGEGGAGGTINISGSTVTASTTVTTVTAGSIGGAGIGGGKGRDGGTVSISGGTVTAGSIGGAGIGGGENGSGGTINISGGTVTANGGGGAGIGGGISGAGGTINISDGMVTASGVSGGSGIGGGENGSGGTVSLTGGIITADNAGSAYDIGGGNGGSGGTLSADGACAVILNGSGTNAAVTLGSCGFTGAGAGSLAGVYMDGTSYTSGSVIDVSRGASGTGYTYSGSVFTINTNGEYLIWNATAENRIVVAAGVDADIILFGTKIQPSSGCAFNMTGATVDLALMGSSTFKSSPGYNGLLCPLGATLTISGSGALNAAASNNSGGVGGSGIGGNFSTACGSITINSGTVTALGGNTRGGKTGVAGIGGGVVNITGGTVNAFSNKGGYAIGDNSNAGSSITITGGTVTATCGVGSYGIGGKGTDAPNITISGGKATATGDAMFPAIGGMGGTLAISGGVVVANSRFGPGIAVYSGETDISGGTVYAGSGDPAEYKDIGATGYEGTLTISGAAIVFLKNNSCITPVTTHINETFPAGTTEVYGTAISVPDTWTDGFGAYLRTCTLSCYANGGSGTAPDTITRLYGAEVSVPDGSGMTRDYYTLSGWNTAADGSGTGYDAGDIFTITADTELYAQWTAHPELTSSDADAKIYTGGRLVLTPNIGGGTWDWDHSFFKATFGSTATFTALKTGTSAITYTVEGQTVSYNVTIEESELPSTGQDFTLIWALCGLSLVAAAAAVLLAKRPGKTDTGA